MAAQDATAPLRVEHLVNSLGQIELWCRAVRQALSSLDPKLELDLSRNTAKLWGEQRRRC